MRTLRNILRSRMAHRTLVRMLALYIRLVFLTARKEFDIPDASTRYMRGDDNAIFAFWHGRMMMMPCICPPSRQMHVLISLHRDGVLISDVMREFSLETIAGSTSRKGREALMSMLRVLRAGDNVAITPDGPRGPHQVAASGVASAAKLSGKPILPVVFSSRRHTRAKSWDRFMLALPFSRIRFCVGEPIVVHKEQSDEEARIAIEQAMNRLTEHADAQLL